VISNKYAREMIKDLGILIVDHNVYMRRLLRTMLLNLGAKSVLEAGDGLAALEMVRNSDPDVMVVERDVPVLSAMEMLKVVRSPEMFPRPNIPVIMLTDQAQRAQVLEAIRLGANELLIRPTSPKALQDRLLAVMIKPRPMVQIGPYYVPQPRVTAGAMG
jgi:CheY-like chemotaxis protein